MDNWKYIFDEDILKPNINFAALFVLNFECLKDYIVTQLRDFYYDITIEDGELHSKETVEYKRKVRQLEKNIDDASLRWFVNTGAITEEDYELYQKMRRRRNDITHELLKNLSKGFAGKDAELFGEMLDLYNKIDKWRINEIEIPTSGEYLPTDYDSEQVFGGQAMILSIINNVVLGNEQSKYKELLNELRKFGIKRPE